MCHSSWMGMKLWIWINITWQQSPIAEQVYSCVPGGRAGTFSTLFDFILLAVSLVCPTWFRSLSGSSKLTVATLDMPTTSEWSVSLDGTVDECRWQYSVSLFREMCFFCQFPCTHSKCYHRHWGSFEWKRKENMYFSNRMDTVLFFQSCQLNIRVDLERPQMKYKFRQ